MHMGQTLEACGVSGRQCDTEYNQKKCKPNIYIVLTRDAYLNRRNNEPAS